MVLYRPRSVPITCTLLETLGDESVNIVTVRNCYIYLIHFFDGLWSITIYGIIIIILVITLMPGIYHYIPETNHVSRVHSFAAVLCLQSVLHVMLIRQ